MSIYVECLNAVICFLDVFWVFHYGVFLMYFLYRLHLIKLVKTNNNNIKIAFQKLLIELVDIVGCI